MAITSWLSLVAFAFVLLTASLNVLWPDVLLFALSLLFALVHLFLAVMMTCKFQRSRGKRNSRPYAYNVILSFLSIGLVFFALFWRENSGGQSESLTGKATKLPELSVSTEIGHLNTEMIPGGEGFGEGHDNFGSSQANGNADGGASGEDALTSATGNDNSEIAEAEDEMTEEDSALQENGEPVESSASDEPLELENKTDEKPFEEVFVELKPRPFTLAVGPPQPPKATENKPFRRPPSGSAAAYGSIASVGSYGKVVKPDRDTSILVFFDASGSMAGAYPPLQKMRDTLLMNALLPCYGTVEQYEKKVKVISRNGEQYLDWMREGFEHSKSIVFVFQDESEGSYYIRKKSYSQAWMEDIWKLRQAIDEFEGSYFRSVLFQVLNQKEGPDFANFLKKNFWMPVRGRSTFAELAANGGNLRKAAKEFMDANPAAANSPLHLGDYYRRSGPISFDVKTGLPEKSSPSYYLRRITAAARELGIDLSG